MLLLLPLTQLIALCSFRLHIYTRSQTLSLSCFFILAKLHKVESKATETFFINNLSSFSFILQDIAVHRNEFSVCIALNCHLYIVRYQRCYDSSTPRHVL
jgi:hypothetical protein